MPRALVVADEVDDGLWAGGLPKPIADLVLGAGDLPFAYLEFLADAIDGPCVFVPGNHDRDLSSFSRYRGLSLKDGFPAKWPGPAGAINVDGRVVDVAGLRIAGLGGSVRYNDGPNQWTQGQQARRARRLTRMAKRRQRGDGRAVDVLLTHAPPRNIGDRPDLPHHGFDCFLDTIEELQPRWLLHGHIHPYGDHFRDHRIGETTIRNVVGQHILELG
jgi:hypothetical protein